MLTNAINIAEIQPKTNNLGIGQRFAIWVQGCPFNCKKCLAPDWIPFKVATPIHIEELAKTIYQTKGTEGITISGGEPMMQAGRLAKLLKLVKQENSKLDVIVFTGFELEHLVWEEAKEFLAYIDVLITGVYIDSLNDNQGLRGSSNQKIIFLTDTLKPYEEYFYHRKRDLEFQIKNDGVLMVGIPEKDFKW